MYLEIPTTMAQVNLREETLGEDGLLGLWKVSGRDIKNEEEKCDTAHYRF